MTDEKICPIMSRPIMMTKYTDMGDNVHSEETEAMFKEVPCQREKCMAWIKKHICYESRSVQACGINLNRSCIDCEADGGIGGYCRLIERGA